MQIMISKHAEDFHGWDLSVTTQSGAIRSLGTINGNKTENNGLAIIFDVDPDVVYGMSCKQVVSKLLDSGPQTLITTKDVAHRLYEHGMKAAWGRIKIKNTALYTSMDTFYSVQHANGPFSIVQGQAGFAVSYTAIGFAPILIASRAYQPRPADFGQCIIVDDVKTTVSLSLRKADF